MVFVFFYWIPRMKARNLDAVRDYNIHMAKALAGPPGPGGPPFCYKPGVDLGRILKTNDLGLRSAPIDQEKKVPRVLVLGDSFTFGYGLMEGEPFCHVLQQRLKGRIDVVNAAVSGFEIQDSVAQYFRLMNRVDPDLIILPFVKNDLDDSRLLQITDKSVFVREPSAAELNDGIFASTTNFLRLAAGSKLQSAEFSQWVARASGGGDFLTNGIGPFAKKRWEFYQSELQRLLTSARQRNAKLAILTFESDDAAFLHPLCRAAEALQIPVFTQESGWSVADPRFRLDWDPHPNAEANRRFADRLQGVFAYFELLKDPAVAKVEPVRIDEARHKALEGNGLEIAAKALEREVRFLPRSRQKNIHQIIGGFENTLGLLGERAVLLLGSRKVVSRLRITAALGDSAAGASRSIEVRLRGGSTIHKIEVSKSVRDFELPLPMTDIETHELMERFYLLEVELRDPVVAAAAPDAREAAACARIEAIEAY